MGVCVWCLGVSTMLLTTPHTLQDVLAHREMLLALDTTNSDDVMRNDIISNFVDLCLEIVELLIGYQRNATLEEFLDHYYVLYNKKLHGKAIKEIHVTDAVMKLGGIEALFDETDSKELAAHMCTPHNRSIVSNYLRDLFRSTSLEEKCGLQAILDGGKVKDVLLDLAHNGTSAVKRRSVGILNALYSRQHSLFMEALEVMSVVSAGNTKIYQLVNSLSPRLYYLANDTQIDEAEAKIIIDVVNQLTTSLFDHDNIIPSRQDLLLKLHCLKDVLAIFDQSLDDEDLAPGG
jgi:hypothetical protein